MDGYYAPDLIVESNVLLWFAPGARLILDPEVVIVIGGDIRAEPSQIFQITDVPGHDMTNPLSGRRGRVFFRTTKMLELYPEWWGAISRPDIAIEDHADALQDCLRAAHTDRLGYGPDGPGTGNEFFFAPLPVVMRGHYFTSRELVVEPVTGPARHFSTRPSYDGITILGRRGTGTGNTGLPTLEATGTFLRHEEDSLAVSGRALLRINGIHGSVLDGINFNGAYTAAVCAQLTGNNARSTTFRNCVFTRALHILMQAGDYVIEDPDPTHNAVADDRVPPLLFGGPAYLANPATVPPLVNGSWDLSFLLFDNCIFDSAYAFDATDTSNWEAAYKVVGLVFHADQTFPMTLNNCNFANMMRACVEAYSGTMVIRGGSGQNLLPARDYVRIGPNVRGRDRPLGGVDIFIGDPLLLRPAAAVPPTGLTVDKFESQSNQFLDTFRHMSASADRVRFFATTLSNVSARATLPGTRVDNAMVVWVGPGLLRSSMRTGTLTMISCRFGGPRAIDLPPRPFRPFAGTVLVDKMSFLVSNVGSRSWEPGESMIYAFDFTNPEPTFVPVPIDGDRVVFPWYRSL